VNAFEKGKGAKLQLYVPGEPGMRPVQRSTGTARADIARKMRKMLGEMKDARDWSLLNAVREKRLTLGALYDAYAAKSLDTLRASLAATNLAAYKDEWQQWVRTERGDTGTDANYRQQVDTLVTDPFPSHELTKARVKQWLGSLEKTSPGTRRKYFYALKSFIGYLIDADVFKRDPLAGMTAPKKNQARLRWVPEDVDRAIVARTSPKYRALFAFLKGTGADVSAALRAVKRDIDFARGVVYLRGTKTDRRAVHEGIIEAWALELLRDHARFLGPNAKLFPGLDRRAASHHHERVIAKVGVEDYTLKDARHSVAVRMRFAGYSFEQIAEQLGNTVHQTATIYARFKPTVENKGVGEA
jgi:integrase